MNQTRPSPFLTFILGLAVLAGAGVVRFWYLSAWTDANKGGAAAWSVQAMASDGGTKGEVDEVVDNLKARGFVNGFRAKAPLSAGEDDTAHLAPGYPVLRAVLEGTLAPTVGFSENPTQLTRWTQAALGSLTALF